ncbi:MAG: C4-dicarboxylate ABC transporter, partial [Pseudomonadota bacterium]
MAILSAMGTIMDLNQWMVLFMFLTFIFMLFRGIPVAYALVGVSLIFAVLGEFVLDEFRKVITQYIDFSSTRISYRRLAANSGRFF